VYLLPCSPPRGSLEQAPATSLGRDSAQEQWEGFWCLSDERYYARCTYADGTEQWHRIADTIGARVLPFRLASAARVRGSSFVSVRRVSSRASHDREALTYDAPHTPTQNERRTLLVGRYGQRSILVSSRRSRGMRGAR
jgi:hypothetical protein